MGYKNMFNFDPVFQFFARIDSSFILGNPNDVGIRNEYWNRKPFLAV